MSLRTRKLVGTILTVLFMTVYALIVMAIGGIYVVGSGFFIELPFYVLGGVAWLPVVMWIIKWMVKPDDVNPN